MYKLNKVYVQAGVKVVLACVVAPSAGIGRDALWLIRLCVCSRLILAGAETGDGGVTRLCKWLGYMQPAASLFVLKAHVCS